MSKNGYITYVARLMFFDEEIAAMKRAALVREGRTIVSDREAIAWNLNQALSNQKIAVEDIVLEYGDEP